MARFVTVENGCDWADCGYRAPEGDGSIVEKTVSIDGKQGRVFQLCAPKHLEAFEEVVLPLMAAGLTVPAPASAKTSGRTKKTAEPGVDVTIADSHINICQADVDGRTCNRPIRRRVGMAQHVRKAHGYESLEAYEAEFGPVT